MKKPLTLTLLAIPLVAMAASTLLRGPVTTTDLARRALTNEDSAGFRAAIGVNTNTIITNLYLVDPTNFAGGLSNLDLATGSNMPVHNYSLYRAAPTPPLMWTTYWDYNVTPTDTGIRALAVQWSTNGMLAAGWNWISIDDGWEQATRDSSSNLQVTANFPSGMGALVTYLHSLGYKVKIYTSYSALTCAGNAGTTSQYVYKDMALFNSWGVDGVKIDACAGQPSNDTFARMFREFGDANMKLTYSRTPMLLLFTVKTVSSFSIPWQTPFEMSVWEDGNPTYFHATTSMQLSDLMNTAYLTTNWNYMVGPGHYNELTALVPVGWSLTNTLKDAMSMFAALVSPIISSSVTAPQLEFMTNSEILAIHQDPACIPATQVSASGLKEVWVRPLRSLTSRSNAVFFVNLTGTNATATVSWAQLGVPSNTVCTVRDAWTKVPLGSYTNYYTSTITPTNVNVLVFSSVANNLFSSTDTNDLALGAVAARGRLDVADGRFGGSADHVILGSFYPGQAAVWLDGVGPGLTSGGGKGYAIMSDGLGGKYTVLNSQGGALVFATNTFPMMQMWASGGFNIGGNLTDPGPSNCLAKQYQLYGTTNQVIFGGTNTAPAGSATTPSKWISVQVQGETVVYRLPLYQ